MGTKAVQGKLWSTAPNYWSSYFEPYFLPMYRKTIDQLNLTGDSVLLDAGCGSGLFSSMSIKAGAQVVGMDAAPGLLEVARKRNPENTFLEEDLETMPFCDESFDVVTGFNSFQYAGNFTRALMEAKRVLKTGGKLVIGIWDKPEMSEASNVLKAIAALVPRPYTGTARPFVFSENGKIERICESIGLKMLLKTNAECPFIYTSLSHGINSFMGTEPAATALHYSDRSVLEEVLGNAFKPFLITDDIYFLKNNFLIFIAEK